MDPEDGGTTDMGLPRRVPMAQLVPGGVENSGAPAVTSPEGRTAVHQTRYAVCSPRTTEACSGGAALMGTDETDTPQTRGKEQEA